MKRILAFIYGITSYLIFFSTFLWLILFLGDFQSLVPATVNSGTPGTIPEALLINLGLIALFGIQHTVVARKFFKEKWTKIVAESIERSICVLFSGLALLFDDLVLAADTRNGMGDRSRVGNLDS